MSEARKDVKFTRVVHLGACAGLGVWAIAGTVFASEIMSGGGGSGGSGGSELKMVTKDEGKTPATKNSDTVTWDGCQGSFQARIVDGKGESSKGQDCGEVKQMDKSLATAMTKAFPYCLRKAGGDVTVKSIKVDVMGCFADRNKNVPGGGSTEKSEHAEWRAIGVSAMSAEMSDDSKKVFNFNSASKNPGGGGGQVQTPEDVDKLRKCWSDAILGLDDAAAKAMGVAAGEKLCGGGGSAQNGEASRVSGSIWGDQLSQVPPKNSKHNDHLHIECLDKGK